METADNFTVFSPLDFIKEVGKEAANAKFRVWGQAMEIEPGEITNGFLQIFLESAKRGIDTRLHADHYSFMVTDGLFNYFPLFNTEKENNRKERVDKRRAAFKELQENGVKMLLTNPPGLLDKLFPMKGRNHMKIVVVDNIAWIGGVNFHDDNFKGKDIMVKITRPTIVDEIAKLYTKIDGGEKVTDYKVTCDNESTLLIDGGKINSSIILDHAVQMTREAKQSVELIAPIIPDGPLLDAFFAVQKKGIDIKIIMPEIKTMTGIYKMLDDANYAILKMRGFKIPIHFYATMIHAKVLITDQSNALFGSHNLTRRGVQMGTQELALKTSNPKLVTNLQNFYSELLVNAK